MSLAKLVISKIGGLLHIHNMGKSVQWSLPREFEGLDTLCNSNSYFSYITYKKAKKGVINQYHVWMCLVTSFVFSAILADAAYTVAEALLHLFMWANQFCIIWNIWYA